jgi:biopolymer transport protein ExbD
MADVGMLLVAFFALTAAFTQAQELPTALGAPDDQAPEDGQAIAIELRLDEDGRAWLLGRRLPNGDLAAPLMQDLEPLLRFSPGRPLFVSTHPEAPLGAFVEVQDALSRVSRRLAARGSRGGQPLRIVVPTLAQEARLRRLGR